jgi:hypothetical protein
VQACRLVEPGQPARAAGRAAGFGRGGSLDDDRARTVRGRRLHHHFPPDPASRGVVTLRDGVDGVAEVA